MTKARELPEYEGLYQITDTGEVHAIRRKGSKGGLRKTYVDHNGYERVTLTKNYKQRNCLVHGLVAAAWLGPRPEGYDVCHKDGDRLNNSPDNLYYGTRSENAKDAVKHGTHNFLADNFKGERVKGEGCSWAKITEEVVRYIRSMKGEKSSRTLAKELSISQGNVSAIWTGKSWSHVV
jgi:hypothetical protein